MLRWIVRIVFLFVVLSGGAWAAGVRFHPGAVPGCLGLAPRKTYLFLELRNGQTIAGRLVRESPELIEIEMGGGVIGFSPAEVRSRKTVAQGSAEFRAASEAVVEAPSRVFSYREEDNLFVRWGWIPSRKRRAPPAAAAPAARLAAAQASSLGMPQPTGPVSQSTYMGIVQKALSREGAAAYARQLESDMQNIPRNPWVEALKEDRS